MKAFTLFGLLFTATVAFLFSGGYFERLQDRANLVNNYHRSALMLAKDNRDLQHQIGMLKFEIQTLEAKNSFLTIKLDKKKATRTIASVKPKMDMHHVLVKDDVYKWNSKQLAMIGNSEFGNKNYEKSAQFFNKLLEKHPRDEVVNDRILFQAGIAAYESQKHYDWASKHLSRLIFDYPTSQYYRGAKLWFALANLRMGKTKAFYQTVEEFRLKYRNTDEWKILSGHYEELRQKYK